ncbi:hypothetical protein BS17DRAFT_553782 [Gyrodon lividus]|nr:hypothetical protein BS17DRAFT_553782 [Gyrodon lividus]
MADTTPHTPPPKPQPLLPDTVPRSHYTSQRDYQTGDLTLGRIAVLKDLGRYLQVPFDCLAECIGSAAPQQDLHRTRNKLITDGILLHNASGLQWKEFPSPPAKSLMSEEKTFQPLVNVISKILEAVMECAVSCVANPMGTPLSDRNNTSRPDGFLVLGDANTADKIHWFDIAVPFEFKKSRDSKAVLDNEQKIIWSLHNIMREDPLRRFTFGITIEDTHLRLWLSNRACLAVAQPIDFLKDIDAVISLFYALGSVTKEGLGWDPTVERLSDGNYKFAVGTERFITTRPISTHGADSMVGRGTRVYEAKDAAGKKVAIKDSWRDIGRDSEGDISRAIIDSIQEKLGEKQAAVAEQYFVSVQVYEDVTISGARDETVNPMKGAKDDGAFKWTTIVVDPILSEIRHLPSTGNVPNSGQPVLTRGIIRRNNDAIPCRVHTRIVFHDVGVMVQDVTCLADNLSCLSGGLKALYYMHKAGWVHRDFSVGNVIWVVNENRCIGKLGDFEYAKKVDSNASHDVRMGTMQFMALEVENQEYLFQPPGASGNDYPDPLGTIPADFVCCTFPSFRMNFLHDIESVWWAFVWVFFYHTNTPDMGYSLDELDAQWTQYQMAFPGAIGQSSRQNFFTNDGVLRRACHTLSAACRSVGVGGIVFFARALLESYREAEKLYPSLVLDASLLEHTHEMASAYLEHAQKLAKAGGIILCPVPVLRNQKRTISEVETSPTPQARKKRRA